MQAQEAVQSIRVFFHHSIATRSLLNFNCPGQECPVPVFNVRTYFATSSFLPGENWHWHWHCHNSSCRLFVHCRPSGLCNHSFSFSWMLDGALCLASVRLSSTCIGRALTERGLTYIWRRSRLEASKVEGRCRSANLGCCGVLPYLDSNEQRLETHCRILNGNGWKWLYLSKTRGTH